MQISNFLHPSSESIYEHVRGTQEWILELDSCEGLMWVVVKPCGRSIVQPRVGDAHVCLGPLRNVQT